MTFSIRKLKKAFNGIPIFENFNIAIKKGKITAFIGPNGCGKSTLFNLIAKLTKKDSGHLDLGHIDKFKFSYAFQNYRETLLPWRNNYDNLIFPLEIRNSSRKEIKNKVREIQKLACFNLKLESYPYELSGGQQQVLAFLRSIITKPDILLLDEPFSALDYDNSLKMMDKLQEYYSLNQSTILLITHDVEDALYLADEIVILSDKPTCVLSIIKNDLPRPRNIETVRSEKFHKIKSDVLKVFEEAIRK